MMLKSNLSDVYFHKFMKIKILMMVHLEKTLNMRNVIILVKSVFDRNYNHYYYQRQAHLKNVLFITIGIF